MKIAKDAYPILLIIALPFLIALYFQYFTISFIFLIFFLFTIYFFRNPHRIVPNDSQSIFSPADGTIIDIQPIKFDEQDYQQISIFMSVFNVHINRIPFAGQIISVKHFPGKFLIASEKAALKQNERQEIILQTSYGKIKFIQIAGFIARKIVCRLKPNQNVQSGEIFGLIKFGSRVDIFIPLKAQILVTPKQKVTAGITKLGTFMN